MNHLGPVARDTTGLVLLADHKAGDVLQEHQRYFALGAQFHKVGALDRRLAEQNAVVGDDAHRVAVDTGEAADQGLAVQGLEFIEVRAVDDTGDHLAHIVGLLLVRRNDAVDILHRVERLHRFPQVHRHGFDPVQATDRAAHQFQRVVIIVGVVVGDPGGPAVDIGAAEFFGTDDLAGGRLYQRRPPQENGALVPDDNGLVGHGGQVGAAGGAGPEHRGDLGNAHGGHAGLVVKGVAEVLPVGKDLILQGQEGAAGVHQVDTGQAIFLGDGLGAALLLDGQGVVGAALDRGVIDKNHTFLAGDAADAGDDTGARHIVLVDLVGGQLGQLQERRARVQHRVEPLPRQQLAAGGMALLGFGTAALADLFHHLAQVINLGLHVLAVGDEACVPGVDA